MLPAELKENSKLFAIIIDKLRNFVKNAAYVDGLVNNFHYPSHVFRLLTTSCNEDNVDSLIKISKIISKCNAAAKKPKSPLVLMLRMFLNKHESSEKSPDSGRTRETHSLEGI